MENNVFDGGQREIARGGESLRPVSDKTVAVPVITTEVTAGGSMAKPQAVALSGTGAGDTGIVVDRCQKIGITVGESQDSPLRPLDATSFQESEVPVGKARLLQLTNPGNAAQLPKITDRIH